MTYLLDTHACLALLRGQPPQVRRRFERALAEQATMLVSSVVSYELWFAGAHSERPDANTRRVQELLSGPLQWIPFDEDDARAAGQLRAQLVAANTPLGAYDVLLAGQAIARGATLVTANVREFEHVPGLHWEDWGKAGR